MKRLVLDELAGTGHIVRLPEHVVVALVQSELVEARPCGNGSHELLPRGNVGAVRVGDFQIEVKPKGKVGIAQILFLLGYARDPGFRQEEIGGEQDEELLPALAASLARLAHRALAGGVHRAYVSIDESARTVRGRIRIGDQITRRPGTLVPLEVTYDDYSPNVAENQILRSAVHLMSKLSRLDPRVRSELAAVDVELDGVSLVERGRAIPRWAPTRLNARYHDVLRLAEILLRHQSVSTTAGAIEIVSFVVPMWKVFEDFIGVALREALRPTSGVTQEQYPIDLDVRPNALPSVHMNIDIVHSVGGRPVIVADAKYKAASTHGRYPNADKYQMLAYCTALGLKQGWLIYAQGKGEAHARRIVNTDIEIVEWSVDLGTSPREILRQVDALAKAMASSAWAPLGFMPGEPVVGH